MFICRKVIDVYCLKWVIEIVVVLSWYEEESGRVLGFYKDFWIWVNYMVYKWLKGIRWMDRFCGCFMWYLVYLMFKDWNDDEYMIFL